MDLNPLRKVTYSRVGQTLRVLGDLGVTLEDLKRLRCDRRFAERLVAFWKAGAVTGEPIPDSDSQATARAIMGKNFLGLEEVRRSYGIALDPEPLAEIPFSEETLQACKDTHVLVAGAALSLNEIRQLAEGDFYETDWYKRESFATTKVGARWYLLRKEPVPESRGKTYDQQCSLLTKEEEVPLACEVTYMVILYWLTHRERLLPDVYVRCRDKGSNGNCVYVAGFGSFGSGEFAVGDGWDNDRLGLASARKR